MVIVAVIIGIFLAAVLIVHTFLTGNTLEKKSMELQDGLHKYYTKNEISETEE